jgi:hypothetical protein
MHRQRTGGGAGIGGLDRLRGRFRRRFRRRLSRNSGGLFGRLGFFRRLGFLRRLCVFGRFRVLRRFRHFGGLCVLCGLRGAFGAGKLGRLILKIGGQAAAKQNAQQQEKCK